MVSPVGVSTTYVGFIGDTYDTTSSFVDSAPEGVSMMELAQFIAVEYASDQESARIVRSLAPSSGDLGEVAFDIVGSATTRCRVYGSMCLALAPRMAKASC